MTATPISIDIPAGGGLRPPEQVMRLERMGASFPTRLSFMRSVMRALSRETAAVERTCWRMDDEGFGHAIYEVALGGYRYSLVAFSTRLDPDKRTDRVIAEAWDTSYVLFDGVPDDGDIARLEANAPLQEAGRFEESDLILSRANKSVRLFEHVADCLAKGVQPDLEQIRSIGYLMRTTAVYGNGKFGIADRTAIASRPGLDGPFRAEMLLVWLIRGFTHDLVEHVARRRSPETFVTLDRNIKRHLGIGNATGLGMAPFLVSHPLLLNNWVQARETALARVCALPAVGDSEVELARSLLQRAARHVAEWSVDDTRQMDRIRVLRDEIEVVIARIDTSFWSEAYPWRRLIKSTSSQSLECQELIVALVLEVYPSLVDDLERGMTSACEPKIDAAMCVRDLADLAKRHLPIVLEIDFSKRSETAQFWYVSEEKLEPRLGERYVDEGADLEMPLDIARQIQALAIDLDGARPDETTAHFMLRHPHHRNAIVRLQTVAQHPYSEIRDNLISEICLPIDMLRFKLAFFGAAKFDPRSDRWTRITMYQGAPLFDEVASAGADDWWLPVLREQT
jgi:hypothetical protein